MSRSSSRSSSKPASRSTRPGPAYLVCGVATLTPLDAAASKLLANSDRWRDDGVLSRDLIDLAMMAPPKALLRQAIAKAEGVYGPSIEGDLRKERFAEGMRKAGLPE